jgi:hypothetical protein
MQLEVAIDRNGISLVFECRIGCNEVEILPFSLRGDESSQGSLRTLDAARQIHSSMGSAGESPRKLR